MTHKGKKFIFVNFEIKKLKKEIVDVIPHKEIK